MLHCAVSDAGMTTRSRIRFFTGLLIATIFAAVRVSSGLNADEARDLPTFRSASRRFVVAADDSADRLMLARWADDLYRRLTEQWDIAAALPREQVFGIVAESRTGIMPGGGVTYYSDLSAGRVTITMRIADVTQLDAESFIETLSEMLFKALIIHAQPTEERGVFDESVPAWMAAGIGQNLYPTLRNRNQAMVVDMWRGGQLPDSAQILQWETLPPHRVFEKAISGIWIAWIRQSSANHTDILRHWKEQRASGWDLKESNLFPEQGFDPGSLGWEAYVASLQRLFSSESVAGASLHYERLRQALMVTPGLSGVPPSLAISPDAGLDVLLGWRRKSWVMSFTRTRRAELSAMAVTGDPEYQALLNRAMNFLDGVRGRRLQFRLRREYADLLESLDKHESLALTREQYVSLLEQRHAPGLAVGLEAGMEGAPHSRLRSYVNGFDKP